MIQGHFKASEFHRVLFFFGGGTGGTDIFWMKCILVSCRRIWKSSICQRCLPLVIPWADCTLQHILILILLIILIKFLQGYKKGAHLINYCRTSTSILWQCLTIKVREKLKQFSFNSIFFGIGIMLDQRNTLDFFKVNIFLNLVRRHCQSQFINVL